MNSGGGVSLAAEDFFPYENPEIKSVHYRSQEVKTGGLFVAISGRKFDGHDFIDEAIQKGAVAIVTQKPIQKNTVIVEVENTRKALAGIASQFYKNPSERMVVIGITGTNGKTTTAYLIEKILLSAGFSTGVIGTINYRYGDHCFNNPVTTPESLDLQRIMAEMVTNGVTHVILEVSSHAIDLFRIAYCQFNIGVFTNLTQDHLDYHVDMNAYWNCKKKFFTEYLVSGPKADQSAAIINCDNSKGKELAELFTAKVVTTGSSPDYMIHPYRIQSSLSGISGNISTPGGDFSFNSNLVGIHNLENILAATGVVFFLDLPKETIRSGIQQLNYVPGRLERIPNHTGRYVYVDYAHTPDALKNVLFAVKAITKGRIICIFGCGGDRDQEKRAQMGEIAGRTGDLVIITSDNPRSEDSLKIISQIIDGITRTSLKQYTLEELKIGFSNKGFVVEPDRRRAIQLGIAVAGWGDTILIAGKGHETYQIIEEQTIPFDDRIEAQKALAQLKPDCLDSALSQNG